MIRSPPAELLKRKVPMATSTLMAPAAPPAIVGTLLNAAGALEAERSGDGHGIAGGINCGLGAVKENGARSDGEDADAALNAWRVAICGKSAHRPASMLALDFFMSCFGKTHLAHDGDFSLTKRSGLVAAGVLGGRGAARDVSTGACLAGELLKLFFGSDL